MCERQSVVNSAAKFNVCRTWARLDLIAGNKLLRKLGYCPLGMQSVNSEKRLRYYLIYFILFFLCIHIYLTFSEFDKIELVFAGGFQF